MAATDLSRKFPTPDAEFGFGGPLSLDANTYIEEHNAPRAETFVRFDASIPVLLAGNVIVDWYLNGVVVPSARVTITAGQYRGTTTYTMSLAASDRLRPQLAQVPSVPGNAITMGARGSLT